MFQSTRPRGARLPAQNFANVLTTVSIHAPARGATRARAGCFGDARFQSTRPRGARRAWLSLPHVKACFNPRARAGRDQPCMLLARQIIGFNPRARAGRDAAYKAIEQGCDVSIHAPARGATQGAEVARAVAGFQSTRPRGARLQTTFRVD